MIFEPTHIKAKSASDAYIQMCDLIDKKGKELTARGEPTKEVMNVSCLITNPKDRIIPISNFNEGFILQETYDILNSNPPRVAHSKEMLEKTMGSSSNIMFFGNELRQACSRWSLRRIVDCFKEDINTRKAVLDLSNRRPEVHTPCLLYAHFIVRDSALHLTVETRGTAVSMGFINDIYFFTLLQEFMYGWLLEYYPELKLGQFLYKTCSLHTYIGEYGLPVWSQKLQQKRTMPSNVGQYNLVYEDWVSEMGRLYWSVDEFMKATKYENIDTGDITTWSDIQDESYCHSKLFKYWNEKLYDYFKSRQD